MEKKKKVGILTFSYSANAGSVLQAYALSKTISGMDGYEASIINYSKTMYMKPVPGKNVFAKPFSSWTPRNIVKWIAQILIYPSKMRKFIRFFHQHYNNFASQPYTREQLVALNDVYDYFVVGSDQVWNYGSPQVDDTYFLDFVKDNSKKISYAASFGQKSIPPKKLEAARKFISDFSSISVREPDGVKIVSELSAKEAVWVLDPSLLLEKEEYQQFSIAPKKKGYVFLYLRQESKRLERFSEKIARANGLSVIKVVNNWLCRNGRKTAKPVGPYEWLGYIGNADYVVTNSFHGICFSIIFEKEFYVDFLNQATSSTNSRLEGMLQQFRLSQRHIDEITDVKSLSKIDYEAVNEFKKLRKQESLSYIKQALERGNI